MAKKLMFVVGFVPVHFFLMLILLQRYWYNFSPWQDTGPWPNLCRVLALVLSVPIVVPFVVTDLGEYWPRWLQVLPFIANSIVWAVVVLLLYAGIKRFRRKRMRPPGECDHD